MISEERSSAASVFRSFAETVKPLLLSYAGLFYIWTLYYLLLNKVLNLISVIILFLLYLPIEICFSRILKDRGRYAVLLHILFWLLYLSELIFIAYAPPAPVRMFFRFPMWYILGVVYAVYLSGSMLSHLTLLLWLTVYYFVVVKRKILRLTVCIVLPLFFVCWIFVYFYYYGGAGSIGKKELCGQKSVSLFFDPADFPKEDYFHKKAWDKVAKKHPRKIYYDDSEKSFFAVYSDTLGEPKEKIPAILKISSEGKVTDYYYSHQLRQICPHGPNLIFAPWYDKKILEIDKNNFNLIRSMDLDSSIYPWMVRAIHYDKKTASILITNDLETILKRYDYQTGLLTGEMDSDLIDLDTTGELWLLKMGDESPYLYASPQGVWSVDLVEIDPASMKLKRSAELGVVELTAITLDEEQGYIYAQSAVSDKLLKINVSDFKIEKTYRGERHSREIILDHDRKVIYLLSYFYGRLICLDSVSGKKLWTLKVGAKPYGMVKVSDRIYVNSRAGIVEIDLNKI